MVLSFDFNFGPFDLKVKNILRGSLDSIQSPSPLEKIQLFGGNVYFCFQKFVDNPQQCFAFTPQGNFPAHNLNFH